MSDYYAVSIDPDFLEHHGIQGQKWGKRNGPPYPLDAATAHKVKAEGEKEVYDSKKHNADAKFYGASAGISLGISAGIMAVTALSGTGIMTIPIGMIAAGGITGVAAIGEKIAAKALEKSGNKKIKVAEEALKELENTSNKPKYKHSNEISSIVSSISKGVDTVEGNNALASLQKMVESKSGNLYESEAKTESFKKALSKYDEAKKLPKSDDRRINRMENAKDDLIDAVIKDIGGDPNDETLRDSIETVVFWD